jgi:outer membrane protease
MASAKQVVASIFDEIKFPEFMKEIHDNGNKHIIIKMVKFIGISGQLNNQTFEQCTTVKFLTEQFNIAGEDITRYRDFCYTFREKCKERGIYAEADGYNVKYSFNS